MHIFLERTFPGLIAFAERAIFYILIFLIPLQTRRIFNYSADSFNEWTSISFYFTDILIILLFVSWLTMSLRGVLRRERRGNPESKPIKYLYCLLAAFVVWSGISLFFAENFSLGLYHWIKLLEMVFLFFYVGRFLNYSSVDPLLLSSFALRSYGRTGSLKKGEGRGEVVNNERKRIIGHSPLISRNSTNLVSGGSNLHKTKGLVTLIWVFISSALVQSGIAIAQFYHQSDLGLSLLHESPLGALLDGVAKINIGGLDFVRSYGTFPHPNLLATFLGIGLFFTFYLWTIVNKKPQKYIVLAVIPVIFTGLFLTFSRSSLFLVLLLTLLPFAYIYFRQKVHWREVRIGKLFLVTFLSVAVLTILFKPMLFERFDVSMGEQAVDLRLQYTNVSLEFIKQSPFFGVGIGGFVDKFQSVGLESQNLPQWFFQPVHNLYLLIASEVGLIGLMLFLGFIGSLASLSLRGLFFRKKQTEAIPLSLGGVFVLCSIVYVLCLAMFDHHFWTLQQGMLMMWLVFGIVCYIANENQFNG